MDSSTSGMIVIMTATVAVREAHCCAVWGMEFSVSFVFFSVVFVIYSHTIDSITPSSGNGNQ